ncbi:MAG: hypothetical protein IT204_09680 [Fimbriimonadaceae bacterium]|nr:hypothetical protein [Fimbriimonadaceae bacterium]
MRTAIWLLWCATLALAADEPAAPAGNSSNNNQTIGDAPAGAAKPGDGAKPPEGATPPALQPPPADAKAAPEPERTAPGKPTKERKRAFINVLDPTSIVKTKGPENSVVARGKLQMVIPDDELILICNAIDYSGDKTGIATLTGDLKILTGKLSKKDGLDLIATPENTITGDIAYVFTKEKRAVVDGKVVVVHDPPEDPAADADKLEKAKTDTTTLFCDRLTYWYRTGDKKAVAQARLPQTTIRFEQATRRGTAGMATFYDFEDGETETGDVLDLVGGVQGEDDDGQKVVAEVCRLFVDQDSSQWYNVKQVIVNLDEDDAAPGQPTSPPAVPDNNSQPAPPTTPTAEPAPGAPAAPAPAAPG